MVGRYLVVALVVIAIVILERDAIAALISSITKLLT